jgi:hypothetical protein
VASATWKWVVVATATAVVLLLGTAASAQAAASYVFEPALSLTGNCATSPLDEVRDPGLCPIPPGVPGVDHPSAALKRPGVTTDAYGDIYVLSIAGKEGRIDIFSAAGKFITEVADNAGPQSIAVDSVGNIYLFERLEGGERQVRRFPPTVYEPLKGEIKYAEPPQVLVDESTKPLFSLPPWASVAVDAGDRLYVDSGENIAIFKSAKEGNELLEKEALEVPESGKALLQSTSIAIDSQHKKIYVSDSKGLSSEIRIFELEPPHHELGEIDGSTTPKGKFLTAEGRLSVDVDDPNGHVFVADIEAANKVFEFKEDGTYIATIEHSFQVVPFGEIAVDDGSLSPHPQSEGWLFVPSNPEGTGHVYAFEPNEEGPPIVESAFVGNVTETDTVLHARINPSGLPTEYRFEYITQQQYEEEGESFANAMLAGGGTLPKGGEGVAVSAPAIELQAGTAYRFRVVAENGKGQDERAGAFNTSPRSEPFPSCSNDSLRVGASALLPDCRAYELVTPPSTNGLLPVGVRFAGVYFPTLEASPDGNRASFLIEGGTLPGQEGAGAFNGDPYLATRGSGGWNSEVRGPSGAEAKTPLPGSFSPDQTYSLWRGEEQAVYVRYPDGHSELVGRGSLGEAPHVHPDVITEGASHIVFEATAQLEPNAAPGGTKTVYDRSAEGPTRVVSLLPGDEAQEAGEEALYLGASEEGEGIAFSIGDTIYLRLHGAETVEVAGPGSTFAGIAKDGSRVFYLEGGDLFAFDAEEEKTIAFSSSGDVTPVNVATDGTHAYFASPSVLTGEEENPNGEKAKAGKEGAQNLYLSEEGVIRFVGRVTKRDAEGEERTDGRVGGLGLWVSSLEFAAPGIDPSRATPSGSTLIFESRADLTSFKSGGFAQVYRYDSAQNRLACLSCNPSGTPPTGDASLQSIAENQFSPEPASSKARIPNQSPDGKRVFFQTAEPLAVGDTDELLDVYEWEEKGTGSCEKAGGCVYLISGGHGSSADYLYAMSTSGNDVFFRTADQLLPRDLESTLSIYDARVDGGFAEPESAIRCEEGETCRPAPTPPPTLPGFGPIPSGPEPTPHRCPKGKHKVKRHGKVVCVRNGHKHKHRRHRSNPRQKGGAR